MADNRLEFQFHECLGQGGFGEVYLATVKKAGITRKMAVKVLREGLSDGDDAVKRLRDEGRILGILNHPAILGATDMCRVDGRIALVMEYVEGMDLASACAAGQLLPQKCVVQAIGEVADALQAAWNTTSPETGNPLRLVHRDIKPENARLTTTGQIKLLDFGIARSTEMSRNAQTKMGELPFTPGYAAPESFRKGEQSHLTDVYALGVTMYRLLVGEEFYEGKDIGQQFATASREEHYGPYYEERLSRVRADDPAILALLRRMLAYDKTVRPEAAEVADTCETLAGRLEGPTLVKWARTATFPAPKGGKAAPLSGQHLFEDQPDGTVGAPPPPRGTMGKAPPTISLSPPPPPPRPTDMNKLGAAPPPSATGAHPAAAPPSPSGTGAHAAKSGPPSNPPGRPVTAIRTGGGMGSMPTYAPAAVPAPAPAAQGGVSWVVLGGLLVTFLLGGGLLLVGAAVLALVWMR